MYSPVRNPDHAGLLRAFKRRRAAGNLAQSSSSPGVLIDAASSVPSQQLLNESVVLDVGIFAVGTHTKASLNGQAE